MALDERRPPGRESSRLQSPSRTRSRHPVIGLNCMASSLRTLFFRQFDETCDRGALSVLHRGTFEHRVRSYPPPMTRQGQKLREYFRVPLQSFPDGRQLEDDHGILRNAGHFHAQTSIHNHHFYFSTHNVDRSHPINVRHHTALIKVANHRFSGGVIDPQALSHRLLFVVIPQP